MGVKNLDAYAEEDLTKIIIPNAVHSKIAHVYNMGPYRPHRITRYSTLCLCNCTWLYFKPNDEPSLDGLSTIGYLNLLTRSRKV